MKINTHELTGAALDWAVAHCAGYKDWDGECFTNSPDGEPCALFLDNYRPSEYWSQGGPLIQQALLVVSPHPAHDWICRAYMDTTTYKGSTPLIAAMRCYVVQNVGDEIDIPEEVAQ